MDKNAFFCLILIVCSCGDNVRFEEPQPEGRQDEKAFPKKIRGVYRSLKDSSTLSITMDQITRKTNTRFAVHKSYMDSSIKIKGDTSFYDEVDKMNLVIKGDSVYGHLKYADTLFTISHTGKLRIFKGYYFLNTETTFNNWEVKLMTVNGHELTILHDWDENDLAEIRKITHSSESTRNFKPSRGQLKTFIKHKNRTDGDKYIKI